MPLVSQETLLSRLSKMRPDILDKFGIEIFGIVGSWARNTANEDSDIDIVYTIKDEDKVTYFDIGGAWHILRTELGFSVDLVDWEMVRPAFRPSMEKDLVRFYE